MNPILTKPKPKADPPPQNKETSNGTDDTEGHGDQSPKQDRQSDEKMDVE